MARKATRNPITAITKQNLKERRILETRRKTRLMHKTVKRTKRRPNVASNVVIEELSKVEDLLCATFPADDTYEWSGIINS